MDRQSNGSEAGIAALAITNALIELLVQKGVLEDSEIHQILTAARSKCFSGHPGRDFSAHKIIEAQMARFMPKG